MASTYDQYNLNHYPEPAMVAIAEGNGSGTKLFQSLLDGHPALLMVPGYPLMYFYPFWDRYVAVDPEITWERVMVQLFERFSPIFDSRIAPGSETLDRLGEAQDQFLLIDKAIFAEAFLAIVKGTRILPRNALLALHYAYCLASGDTLTTKTHLIYHIHVFFYVEKYLIEDFPKLKVIASVRDPRANLRRREINSIVKQNSLKFRTTDAMVMKPRAYRQTVRFILDGLDALDCVPVSRCRVYRHEDLVLRLDAVMAATAEFLEIAFHPCLVKPTFASLPWKTSFYDFDTNQVANPEVLKQSWRTEETANDIFVVEACNSDYIGKYAYADCTAYRGGWLDGIVFVFAALRTASIERKRWREILSLQGLRAYLDALSTEAASLHELRDYRSNMFFSLKWTNDGIDFSKPKLFERLASSGTEPALRLARAIYLGRGLYRYAACLARLPLEWTLRVGLVYSSVIRRLRGRRYLPEPL